MTNRERVLLIAGVLFGITLGSLAVIWVRGRATQPEQQSAVSAQASAAGDLSAPQNAGGTQSEEIELSKAEQDAIGLRISPVALRPIAEELRTVGRVEQAESQLTTIAARVGGRIEKLYIDFTGQPVKRGQPIANIYSPQVVSSAEEYRLAIRARKNLGPDAHPQAIAQGDDLIQASRRRLELWGFTTKQIDEITNSDKPQVSVTTYSTVNGVITERKVAEGQYVQEGEALYSVSDLSSVWVLADVYEADLHNIRIGQVARIEVEGLPGSVLRGTVSFIDPSVKPETRTASVRIQLSNAGMKLRPGMFVQVLLGSGSSKQLTIPRSAVLDTGENKFVYIAKADGIFEKRVIEAGPVSGELIGIRQGLRQGESVVANGAFLIDSQTRVSGGMSGMFGGSKGFENDKSTSGGEPASAKYTLNLRFEPDPPQGEKPVRVFVDLQDEAGKPVTDASVAITFLMPAMPAMGMAEMRNTHPLTWDGKHYSGEGKVQSNGSWIVMVDATRGGQRLAWKRTQITAR
ncbi:MAG TPA: efflux RND transporter periplasmic adaptor subunit [Terriglobales bacterium]|nr:efflux RND transporter periplasmic adaptor subunit [Terriglobales bacterium]